MRCGRRIPMPWSGDHAPCGFSPVTATRPTWLPQPEHWAAQTVAAQDRDPAHRHRRLADQRLVPGYRGQGGAERVVSGGPAEPGGDVIIRAHQERAVWAETAVRGLRHGQRFDPQWVCGSG